MDELMSAVTGSENSWRIPHLPLVKLPRFDFHDLVSTDRHVVEAYIQTRFNRAHGATISHYLPNLISLSCGDMYTAAVGLAPAGAEPLFCECYLPDSIEHCIGAELKTTVERKRILEIGNLVSTWKGSSLLLFILLSELIERVGFHWVTFTATREVENLLARMQYAPTVIALADPAVLPDSGASWGSYYKNHPRVMFGDVRAGVAVARTNTMYRTAVACIEPQIESIRAAFMQGDAMEKTVQSNRDDGSAENE